MDPREISPDQWQQITGSVVSLTVCVGLGLCAALAVLSLRVLVPAEALSGQVPGIPPLHWVRWALWPIVVLAALGAVIALVVGLSLAVEVISSIYPRFLI